MKQNRGNGKEKSLFLKIVVVFLVMTLTMPLMFSSAISTNVTETNNINITAKETKQKIAENPSVVLFDENSNNTYSNINESLIINQKYLNLERLNRVSRDNVNCSDIDRLTMIYAAYAALVNFGRGARFTLAADLLDHFLDNTGTYYTADSKYFKNDRYVKKAQREYYTLMQKRK